MTDLSTSNDADQALLEGLNPEQRQAVLHGDGPLLIVAGAGSGKTRVLTHRIAHLIRHRRVNPQAILAITFTNKAASQMKDRVGRLVGDRLVGVERDEQGVARARPWGGMWVSTFHSACARLLRAEAPRLGYQRSFTIYDAADSTRLVGLCLKDLGIDPKRVTPRGAAAVISNAKNEVIDFDTFALRAETWYDKQVADVYRLYQERLHRASAFDFDDLLVKTVEIFELFDDVVERYRGQFEQILVDEWQDTNRAQYEMVRLLSWGHRNLTVVGDGDQCLPAGTLISTSGGPVPIEQVQPDDEVTGTCGRAEVATGRVTAVMPGHYDGPLWAVRAGGHAIRGTPHHIVLARVPPQPDRHFVYLMHSEDRGYRIGRTQGARPATKSRPPEPGYVVRINQEHADRLWILRICESLPEAAYWEAYYAAEYGLPTALFHGMGRKLSMDESLLKRLYTDLDTPTRAKELMRALDLHPEFPHYRTANGWRRQTVTLLMFGDPRGPAGMHRIQWCSIRADVARRLGDAGFPVRPNGKGGHKVEVSRAKYEDALTFVRAMAAEGGLEVKRRALIDQVRFEFTPLSHLHPGMVVLVEDGDYFVQRTVDAVAQEHYCGPVYDLEVEPTHTYVADGILVHNSIYKFRGADIRNILDFERDFPDARRITLDRNYRSTQTILDAANAVIANNTQRIPKRLWTDAGGGVKVTRYTADNEHDEAAFVAEEVDRLAGEGYRHGDIAVFYRTNAQSRVLEEVLIRLGLPYQVIGGTRFYERKEVKDLLAYLQLLVNPADDIAAKRVLNVPRRGIGAKSEAALDLFAGREGVAFLDACRRAEENHQLSARATGAVLDFVRLLDGLRTTVVEEQPELREIVQLAWERSGYLTELEAERTVEALGRVENVRELAGVAEDFAGLQPDATLAEFLERVSLVSDADNLSDDTSRLTLMTMHNAKGLEFPVVFVVGMEDSVFPHHRALGDPDELEEERRLAYVAMTRAEQRLYLTSAWSRTLFGATNANPPSRFLAEVPEELVEQRSNDRGGPSRRAVAKVGVRSQYRPGASEVDETFGPGDRVRHPTFGPGKILELTGTPGSEEALIRFDEYGTKRLLLAYAPLIRSA
ncbi:MAG: UvrD-helicase domain-containing protein [Actinomycetota bacterium]|jgi:DNA helicase-2/ATP-dependent DNA helicase PcrA|nr:UvrD-helicase domain-containing protein [Actinomycetota bacterium]